MCPVGCVAFPGDVEVALECVDQRSGGRRNGVAVEDRHVVGCGVVFGSDEPGVGRDGDATVDQARTHLGVVEDRRCDPCARSTGRTSAGAAVE
jgi:hypothetical protein